MSYVVVENCKKYFESQEYTKKWVKRELTNFDYLCLINKYSSRSFNDISQYPVFPWVLTNYSKEKLDLNDPSIYRDFTHPMSVQSDKKKEITKMKYLDCDQKFKYHFGIIFTITKTSFSLFNINTCLLLLNENSTLYLLCDSASKW